MLSIDPLGFRNSGGAFDKIQVVQSMQPDQTMPSIPLAAQPSWVDMSGRDGPMRGIIEPQALAQWFPSEPTFPTMTTVENFTNSSVTGLGFGVEDDMTFFNSWSNPQTLATIDPKSSLGLDQSHPPPQESPSLSGFAVPRRRLRRKVRGDTNKEG
jgi:hypothetical protein